MAAECCRFDEVRELTQEPELGAIERRLQALQE